VSGGGAATESVPLSATQPIRRSATGELRLIATLLGGLAGGAIAWSNHDRQIADKWVVFVVLATVLGAAAGESFDFGAARWREVAKRHDLRLRQVLPAVLTVITVAAGLVATTPAFLGGNGLTWRGVALSTLAIVGGLPAAATLGGVQQVCRAPLTGRPGEQLGVLLALRRQTARLLNQLGLLVVLIMAVNGAAVGWGQDLPTMVVIFSGAVASLVVGTMYVPASATLRLRAAIFLDEHFSLADVPVNRLVDAADERSRLDRMLGVDQTTFGELKAGLVIMTPFVVSSLASLLPHL
jgi:hypothetical protein